MCSGWLYVAYLNRLQCQLENNSLMVVGGGGLRRDLLIDFKTSEQRMRIANYCVSSDGGVILASVGRH